MLALRDLVEAFLRPDIEAIIELQGRGPDRAALIGRAYGQPTDAVRELMYRQFEPVSARYIHELAAAAGHLDADTLQWRLRWCIVGVIIALFSNADRPDGPIDPADPEQALRRVVDFVTAGLEAPMT